MVVVIFWVNVNIWKGRGELDYPSEKDGNGNVFHVAIETDGEEGNYHF